MKAQQEEIGEGEHVINGPSSTLVSTAGPPPQQTEYFDAAIGLLSLSAKNPPPPRDKGHLDVESVANLCSEALPPSHHHRHHIEQQSTSKRRRSEEGYTFGFPAGTRPQQQLKTQDQTSVEDDANPTKSVRTATLTSSNSEVHNSIVEYDSLPKTKRLRNNHWQHDQFLISKFGHLRCEFCKHIFKTKNSLRYHVQHTVCAESKQFMRLLRDKFQPSSQQETATSQNTSEAADRQ